MISRDSEVDRRLESHIMEKGRVPTSVTFANWKEEDLVIAEIRFFVDPL